MCVFYQILYDGFEHYSANQIRRPKLLTLIDAKWSTASAPCSLGSYRTHNVYLLISINQMLLNSIVYNNHFLTVVSDSIFTYVLKRYPLRSVRHSDESRRVDYSSITVVPIHCLLLVCFLVAALSQCRLTPICVITVLSFSEGIRWSGPCWCVGWMGYPRLPLL